MASDFMAVAIVLQNGSHFFANVHAFPTTGVEFASLGRVDRAGNIAFEDDAIHLDVRIGNRNGG